MTSSDVVRRFCIPTHLASFLGRVGTIYNPQKAIDPCCDDTSAIEAFSYVPERYAFFRNPIAFKEAARLAPFVRIELRDILRVAVEDAFDMVVAIVPFGVREQLAGRLQRLDQVIAERCLDILALNGVCLLIVPPNFLTAQAFLAFRDRVLQAMSLDAVIELAPRSLWERSAVGAALLVIRRGPARKAGTYIATYDPAKTEELISGVRDGVGHFFVQAQQLHGRWDRHFHDPAHRAIEARLGGFEIRRLDELGDIRRGNPQIAQRASDAGEYLVLSPRHVQGDSVVVSERDRFVDHDKSESFSRHVVLAGDVVVSLMQPNAYVYQTSDPPAVAGPNVAVIRSRDNEYIGTYLNTVDGKDLFRAQAQRHSASMGTLQHLSISALSEIRIPLLPLDDLNSISDKAIAQATTIELESLRRELLEVRAKLQAAEFELERERRTEGAAHRRLVERQLALIVEQQRVANAKLDEIVQILSSVREDIGAIKQSSRDEEEKLSRIYSKLDTWMQVASEQRHTMQEYTRVVQTWLDQWDRLESLTQTLLPSAEHLYDELEKIRAEDFSPFVVQYCRSLENEILLKLFCAYHDDVLGRVPDIRTFVGSDLVTENTKRFAKSVLDDKRKYTLGEMNFTMKLLKDGGRTLANSKLLQDFRAFVLRYFDQKVLERTFLERIDDITENLRNKAAHPSLVPKEVAEKCIEVVRLSLCELLDAYGAGGR